MLEGEKVVLWLPYMLLPPQINKCETILRCTAKMAPTKLPDFVTWQVAGLEVDRSYLVSCSSLERQVPLCLHTLWPDQHPVCPVALSPQVKVLVRRGKGLRKRRAGGKRGQQRVGRSSFAPNLQWSRIGWATFNETFPGSWGGSTGLTGAWEAGGDRVIAMHFDGS